MLEEPLTLWTYSSTTQTNTLWKEFLAPCRCFLLLPVALCAPLSSPPFVLLWLDLDILAGIWNIHIRTRAARDCFQTSRWLKELISKNLKWLLFPHVLQFSRKALAVQIPFLGNLGFVYIVACSVTGKSGVIARLTWTTFMLHVFGSQERGLYPSETPFFPSFTLLSLKHLQCVLLVPACILHAGAAAMGRVAHLTHWLPVYLCFRLVFVCLFFLFCNYSGHLLFYVPPLFML